MLIVPLLKCLMPPARSCTKCKSATAAEGDSWCTGCTSWEFIGRELCGSWDSSGTRVIANDLVVNTARQVRALRSLGAGLARVGTEAPSAGSRRVREEKADPKKDERETLPRRRSEVPPPPASSAKEEDLSEEVDEEESEEEEGSGEHSALGGGGHHRPPEPEGPPPGTHRDRRREDTRVRSRGEVRDHHHRGRERDHSYKRKRTSGGRRGGRKHQRLYRLAADPNLLVHRKPSNDFWALQTGRRETLESDRLGC